MSRESITNSTISIERLERVSNPALILFTDADKFQAYLDFKRQFTGEPSSSLPIIEKEVGTTKVIYDSRLISAITDSGSHLVHIRRGRGVDYETVDQSLRYFVITRDLATLETSELWVKQAHKTP